MSVFTIKKKGAFPMLGLAKSSIWLFMTIPVCRDMNWHGGKPSLEKGKKMREIFNFPYLSVKNWKRPKLFGCPLTGLQVLSPPVLSDITAPSLPLS
jgi:hypothetical protein